MRARESSAQRDAAPARDRGPAVSPPLAAHGELGRGRPLDTGVASRMGAALGHRFADVRIHDGPEGAGFASRHQAVAATVGTDIAFAPGAYQPGTDTGDALLAHELAHVQQQHGAVGSGAGAGAVADSGLETDAHEAAVGAMIHTRGVTGVPAQRGASRRSGLGVQRCGTPSWAPAMPSGTLTPSNGRPFITGARADAMLAASPTVGPFLRTRIETGVQGCTGAPVPQRSAGHVFFHPTAEMQDAYLNYLSRRSNVDTGSTYTEAEARAAPLAAGFRDENEIHLNEDTAQLNDTIHESLHRHSAADAVASVVGGQGREGITEYLAQRVLNEQVPPIVFVPVYVDQVDAIRTMITRSRATTDDLCEFYFNGNAGPLRDAVDQGHPGRFDQWAGFMKQNPPDYAAANALFPLLDDRLEPRYRGPGATAVV